MESWWLLAACRGEDNALFFPTRNEDSSSARAVCARCPVVEECRDYAIGLPDLHGIWGMTSRKERERLRRRRQAAARRARSAA